MEKNELDNLLSEAQNLIKKSNDLSNELKEMKEGVTFLQNEYKTNKKYFRLEPGRVTIEDVIKTAFEFGWASHNNYLYKKERNESTENSWENNVPEN